MMHIIEDDLSSRPALGGDGGGVNVQAGSQGDKLNASPNVIRFPSGKTFLPDSRATERELSIDSDDRDGAVACVLAVFAGFLGAFIGAGLYLGSLFFSLFDFG